MSSLVIPAPRRGPKAAPSGPPVDQRPFDMFLQAWVPLILILCLVTMFGMRDHIGASLLSGALILLAGWFVRRDSRKFGGLTFASCFVAVSTFVFGARAIYVILNDDYSIIVRLGLPLPVDINHFVDALVWVLGAMTCFVAGALLGEYPAAVASYRRSISPDVGMGRNLTLLFLLLQIAALFALAPSGLSKQRVSLNTVSDNAYVYLLPTLVHGFNLYAYVYIARRVYYHRSFLDFVWLGSSIAIAVVDAYFLFNMSSFRGFYSVGLFTIGIATLMIFFRKISVWCVLGLFAIYPLFKSLGTDRTLTNEQIVEQVLMNPMESYSKEGIDRAFGYQSDINMLDTLIASLHYEHHWRPYVLSYLYPLVHWVPRGMWPTKPRNGVLADLGYTHGIPYSPGIIGFINDDGGPFYMLLVMGLLGWFMRWWQIWTDRIRYYELRVVAWSAFFLTALVTVRYLPYQSFYGFMIFFVPALLYNALVYIGRKPKPVKKARAVVVPAIR